MFHLEALLFPAVSVPIYNHYVFTDLNRKYITILQKGKHFFYPVDDKKKDEEEEN